MFCDSADWLSWSTPFLTKMSVVEMYISIRIVTMRSCYQQYNVNQVHPTRTISMLSRCVVSIGGLAPNTKEIVSWGYNVVALPDILRLSYNLVGPEVSFKWKSGSWHDELKGVNETWTCMNLHEGLMPDIWYRRCLSAFGVWSVSIDW